VNGSANGFVFGQSAVQSERLETGPAHGSLVKQVVPTSQDWWTHRGGAARNGASTVSLPAAPYLRCSYTPQYRYDTSFAQYADRPEPQPTPAATAGDLVFWGGSDGYIRCFSTLTGLNQWEYPTGAAVMATPTVWDGCVYAGSADGYAYCLDAHTGRLVWRFRGAPAERRINLYGQMSSTWPIHSGITVSGDTVYFTAGYRDNFGTHVYALNAKTGAIVWQNNTAGACYVPADYTGITPGGYGLMVRGSYWQKALAFGRNGIFNGATGALAPLATSPNLGTTGGPNNNGREIGLLDNSHLIYGGAWWWMDKQDQGLSDRKRSFSVHTLDAQGNVLYPEVTIPMNSIIAPAWDNSVFVIEVKSGHNNTGSWLEKWSVAAMVSQVESLRSSNPTATTATFGEPAFASSTRTSLSQWSSGRAYVHAIALAANAVAVAMADLSNNQHWQPMSSWRWHLAYLDRTTGDTLWQTQLPSMPVRNGIAINRSGNVIVSLYSGSVLRYGEGAVRVAARGFEQPGVSVPPLKRRLRNHSPRRGPELPRAARHDLET
jgi:outer membrane protein assembly factor BamB